MNTKFWCGGIFALCILSLFQDYLGQDLYMQMVQDHWAPAWFSVPFALILLIVSYVMGTDKTKD